MFDFPSLFFSFASLFEYALHLWTPTNTKGLTIGLTLLVVIEQQNLFLCILLLFDPSQRNQIFVAQFKVKSKLMLWT